MIKVDYAIIGMVWAFIIAFNFLIIPTSLFDLPHKEKRVRAIILIVLMLTLSISSTLWIRKEAHVSRGVLTNTDITVNEVDSITLRFAYVGDTQFSLRDNIDSVELNNDTYENVIVTAEEHYITHANLLGLKIDIIRTDVNRAIYVNEYVYNALNSNEMVLYEIEQMEDSDVRD